MAKVSKILVQLWSAILALIFLAVAILGIVAIVLVKKYPGIGAGLVVFGIIGLVVSIAGMCGAGFEKEQEKDTRVHIKAALLVLFFAIMVILQVLFVVFGVSLIAIQPSVKMLITIKPESFSKIYDTLPESFRENHTKGAIEKIQKFALTLGIIIIIVSVIIFITCIAAAFQMGQSLFIRFSMLSFSLVEIIVGFAIGIFLLIINRAHQDIVFGSQVQTGVIVSIIVSGFVLGVIGLVGLVASLLGHRYKWITAVFNIGNVILLIAFLVLFILSIVKHSLVDNWANGLCKVDDSLFDPCTETVGKAKTNWCGTTDDTGLCDYSDDDLKKDVKQMVKSFTIILMFVCLYLDFLLVVVVIATFFFCCKKQKLDGNQQPVYDFY